MNVRCLGVLISVVVVASACSDSDSRSDELEEGAGAPSYYPADDWATGDPEES